MKKNQKSAKRRGRNAIKCPVQIGSEYTVDITGTTPNGAGIARVKGFVVLVNNARPGENKNIVITKTDSLNAEAEIIS